MSPQWQPHNSAMLRAGKHGGSKVKSQAASGGRAGNGRPHLDAMRVSLQQLLKQLLSLVKILQGDGGVGWG